MLTPVTATRRVPRLRRRVTTGLFVARDQHKLTLTALAARLDVSPIHLGRVEQGLRRPSLDLLERLAAVLDVDIDVISARESEEDAA